VHIVRSQILRLLDPPSTASLPADAKVVKEHVAAAKSDFIWKIRQKFLKHATNFLRNPESTVAQDKLEQIFYNAAEISSLLWTQRSSVSISGMKSLHQPFNSASEVHAAHQLHAGQLDQDDSCLDGKKIVLVIHPAVYAIGDSEGNNYSTRRILKKAVVWMGTKDHQVDYFPQQIDDAITLD
jgi:hypothetical protein